MKFLKSAIFCSLLVTPSLVIAQQPTLIASESRDASLAYLGTTNFIVGRVGSECLTVLKRSDSPQQFAAIWQQRNIKYLNPAAMYMEKRLEEAQKTGGEEKKSAVFHAATSVARTNGETVVRGWFEKGNKEEACKRAVGLIESGAFDVTPQVPLFSEIEALVLWTQKPN